MTEIFWPAENERRGECPGKDFLQPVSDIHIKHLLPAEKTDALTLN